MNYYNIEKLIKVTVTKASIARWYIIRKERKIKGIIIQKAGIYDCIIGDYLGNEVPEYHFIKDDNIYENPGVTLHYQDNYRKVYYFDTYEQAQKFAKEIVSRGNFIN